VYTYNNNNNNLLEYDDVTLDAMASMAAMDRTRDREDLTPFGRAEKESSGGITACHKFSKVGALLRLPCKSQYIEYF
jgi:hypothetical protein